MSNEFLDNIYLDPYSLENQRWQSFFAYSSYRSDDVQHASLQPLQEVKTTILKLYQQVSESSVEIMLRLKQLASNIKDNDDMNYGQAFKSVNPYIYGYLSDYYNMVRSPQNFSYDNLKLLDFDAQFNVLAPMFALYDQYFTQLKEMNYVPSEVVFTIVIASDIKYFYLLSQRVKQKYQDYYDEIKNIRIAPPGKFVQFSSYTQYEKQFQNTDYATMVESPAYGYLDDIDLIPQFIDKIRLYTGDLGAKLLILDNLDYRRSDIYLSVSYNLTFIYQLAIQTAIAIAPYVVITNGCCIIKFREIVAPAMASLLYVLANFYGEVSYFRPNFGRAIEYEKWVYCGKKKRVDKTLANQIVGELIQISQRLKQYDIPSDINEEFMFPRHFLPIRNDLADYCRRVNYQCFTLQARILKYFAFMYGRVYEKQEVLQEAFYICRDHVHFIGDDGGEIAFDDFLQRQAEKSPKVGLLFPSNEKREIIVYRYLSKINPNIYRYDLQFILYDAQKSKNVRFSSTEVKKQSLHVVRVQSQKEKDELARIERERLEQEKKEQAEREKQEKIEQEKLAKKQQKGEVTRKVAVTAVQSKTSEDSSLPSLKQISVQKRPFDQQAELSKQPAEPPDVPRVRVASAQPEPVQKPAVTKEQIQREILAGKTLFGKDLLRGKQLQQYEERPKDQPKETKKKEKNLLQNVRRHFK